jgi:methylmalonyl-CoA mutase C-terminal domain/subunit
MGHDPLRTPQDAVPRMAGILRAEGVEDIVITFRGRCPTDDVSELKRPGVAEGFTPGASTDEIVEFVHNAAGGRG